MDNEMVPLPWWQKAKRHLYTNRKTYAVGGLCLVGGVTLGAFGVPGNRQAITGLFNWRATNIMIVRMHLERRGHPGFVVRRISDGMTFASQNHAAESLGISSRALSEHLNGLRPNVAGMVFERLGEATTN